MFRGDNVELLLAQAHSSGFHYAFHPLMTSVVPRLYGSSGLENRRAVRISVLPVVSLGLRFRYDWLLRYTVAVSLENRGVDRIRRKGGPLTRLGSMMMSILIVGRDGLETHRVAETLNTAYFAGTMVVYARRLGNFVCIAFRRGIC